MGFRFSHIRDYNTFLSVDVGSYHIRTLTSRLEKAGSIETLGFSSTRQGRQNTFGWRIVNMRWVTQSIEKSILKSCQESKYDVEDAIFAFSSDAYVSDSVTMQYIRKSPTTPITLDEVDEMIKKIEAQSFSRIHTYILSQYGTEKQDVQLVSSILTSITIDGQVVTNPIGFTGKTIRLSIFNIFLPTGEFNIMRSIVEWLERKTISIIPTPLIYTRAIEETEYAEANNIFIDIGHGFTTFLFSSNNQIESFITYKIGFSMLYDELKHIHPEKTQLEFEKALLSYISWGGAHHYKEEFDTFFYYIVDLLMVFIEQKISGKTIHNIIGNGAFLTAHHGIHFFKKYCEKKWDTDAAWMSMYDILKDEKIQKDGTICYGLSHIAEDLLLIKKDPFIRILRYILYQYE